MTSGFTLRAASCIACTRTTASSSDIAVTYADRPRHRRVHVRDHDVGAGLGEARRRILIEHVRAGEHSQLVRLAIISTSR
jgi:hypothetical protein